MVLYQLAMTYFKEDTRRLADLRAELRQLPSIVQRVLDNKVSVVEYSSYLANYEHAFFIGRGVNYPVALEGALKLKEISYIHAEGYATGKIKHGPLAILGSDAPVIAIVAKDDTYEFMLNNIKEIKARGSPVMAVAEDHDDAVEELVDYVVKVPQVDSIFRRW